MIGPSAQLHLLHSRFEQASAGLVDGAILADLAGSHIGVGLQGRVCEALPLHRSGCLDPLPYRGAGFVGAFVAQFLEGYPRDFDVDVDPIQQRAGYFFWKPHSQFIPSPLPMP